MGLIADPSVLIVDQTVSDEDLHGCADDGDDVSFCLVSDRFGECHMKS